MGLMSEVNESKWVDVAALKKAGYKPSMWRHRKVLVSEDPVTEPDGETIRARYVERDGTYYLQLWEPDLQAYMEARNIRGIPPGPGWVPLTWLVKQGVPYSIVRDKVKSLKNPRIPVWRQAYKVTWIREEDAYRILERYRRRKGLVGS